MLSPLVAENQQQFRPWIISRESSRVKECVPTLNASSDRQNINTHTRKSPMASHTEQKWLRFFCSSRDFLFKLRTLFSRWGFQFKLRSFSLKLKCFNSSRDSSLSQVENFFSRQEFFSRRDFYPSQEFFFMPRYFHLRQDFYFF